MKKVFALILALLMLMSMAACGRKQDPAGETTDPAVSTAGNAATKESEPAPIDAAVPGEDLTVHENTFFTVGYKEEDGWTLAEDDIDMSEYGGYAHLRILDEDGNTGLFVYIEAYEESASSFRETLHANGVDLKAYVDGTWVSETIGGLQMAAVDKEDGEWYFFGRDEAAGVSYTVSMTDREDPRAADLVQNITFTAASTDNMDPPWPWEGQPFSGGTLSQMVGTYNLTAQFLPMGDPMVTYETFDHDIVAMGDKVYLLSDCVLYQYAYDGNPQLSLETRMEDRTSLGQHMRKTVFPVETRESCHNSRNATWFPRHRKMRPLPPTASQEKSHVPS